MTLSERLASNFKAELVARVSYILANGLIILLLTRFLLTREEYGLLVSALSVFAVAGLFTQLGWAKSAARYVTEFQENEPGQVRHVVRTGLKYTLVTTVAVAVLFGIFEQELARLAGDSRLAPFMVVGVGFLVVRSLGVYFGRVLQGFNAIRWSASVRAVESVGRVLFVAVLVLAGYGALGALVGYALGYALSAVLGLYVLYTRFYAVYPKAVAMKEGLSKRIRDYSVPLTATYAANVLDKKVDIILVGLFINPAAVALYALASQVVGFLQAPAASIGYSVSPTYGEQKASNQLSVASQLYQTTLRHTLLLYIPVAAGIVLVADPLIRYVIGTDYLGAVPVLQILGVYVVLTSINAITSDAIDFLGRAKMRAYAKGGTSVANFVLNVALIPTLGIVGAAAATVITQSVYVGVNLYVIHSEFSLDLRRLAETVGFTLAITGAMVLAVSLLMPHVTSLFTLLAVVATGGLVWVALAGLSGMLDVRRFVALLS